MATAVQDWLNQFTSAAEHGDSETIAALFATKGAWRDYLAFGWTLQTVEGQEQIAEFAQRYAANCQFKQASFAGQASAAEGFFHFQTHLGNGRGYIRLQDGRCTSLFTLLQDLSKLPAANLAPHKAAETKTKSQAANPNPFVLIVGGGQSGLALGAQLADLGVPYLIVDKHPRVGDQWRSRYESLVLHDPVWYDHMPFMPFPEHWPVFTPKNQMGDWLELYAERLALSIRTNTEMKRACYDETASSWHVTLQSLGKKIELKPSHLVFALGISGFPKVPEFSGQKQFRGVQCHSSAYQAGTDMTGKRVVIIGANNSAHDIAADLAVNGAKPTLIQRSSTLVVRQQDFCEKVLGSLYSQQAVEKGITADIADFLATSVPLRQLEIDHRLIWDEIRQRQAAYYNQLIEAGYTLDFAEDGTGLGMKYRRTASGYYIDVGATDMVVDGRIGIRSGVNVERITPSGIKLDSGEELPADAIIYATGFGTMTDWVAALIGKKTAERIGPCWGYGSGTKGDPGPWLGELRNMWMPTAQPGLWFMGGNLSQGRFYSRVLALQLQGRFLRLGTHSDAPN